MRDAEAPVDHLRSIRELAGVVDAFLPEHFDQVAVVSELTDDPREVPPGVAWRAAVVRQPAAAALWPVRPGSDGGADLG